MEIFGHFSSGYITYIYIYIYLEKSQFETLGIPYLSSLSLFNNPILPPMLDTKDQFVMLLSLGIQFVYLEKSHKNHPLSRKSINVGETVS